MPVFDRISLHFHDFAERTIATLRELESLGYEFDGVVYMRKDDRKAVIIAKDGSPRPLAEDHRR